MLKIALQSQLTNQQNGEGEYFQENQVAKDLAGMGSITRPGVSTTKTVQEYANEQTANQPAVRWLACGASTFHVTDFWRDGTDDRFGDVVLNRE